MQEKNLIAIIMQDCMNICIPEIKRLVMSSRSVFASRSRILMPVQDSIRYILNDLVPLVSY
jgi:hypothetical protein